jgi:hypothetical protein
MMPESALDTTTSATGRHPLAWYEAVIERDMDKAVTKASKVGGGGSEASAMDKIARVGGMFVILYLVFLGLTTLTTMGQMENYLVSELYSEPATTDDSFKQEDGETGLRRRDTIQSKFYNEIRNDNDPILDHTKVGAICPGDSRLG